MKVREVIDTGCWKKVVEEKGIARLWLGATPSPLAALLRADALPCVAHLSPSVYLRRGPQRPYFRCPRAGLFVGARSRFNPPGHVCSEEKKGGGGEGD